MGFQGLGFRITRSNTDTRLGRHSWKPSSYKRKEGLQRLWLRERPVGGFIFGRGFSSILITVLYD